MERAEQGGRGDRVKYSDGKIKISVRELCAASDRSGDLDNRRAPVPYSVLLRGAELHRDIQNLNKLRYEDYETEVTLSHMYEYHGVRFDVSGICDAVYNDRKTVTVEEYKSALRLPKSPTEIHLNQLRLYGYLICIARSLDGVRLRLTYIKEFDPSKTKSFDIYATRDELYLFFEYMLSRVYFRAFDMYRRYSVRLPKMLNEALFPYSALRAGQSELIQECHRAMNKGKRLFAQAPTGIGKTLSVLYPAVRSLAELSCDKVFYLTAKASTGREAFAAAKRLYENGAALRCCTVSAKEQTCICEAARASGHLSSYCNPDDCPYAKGYYDRADSAIASLIGSKSGYSKLAIIETAKQYSVCPYELSLDLSEFCDIVICDYNYVFDGAVYFRRYFGPDAPKRKNVFLIDESHNLPDRVRDMYSCEILRTEFEELYRATGNECEELDASLERVILFLRSLRKLCRDNLVKTPDGERGFYMSREKINGLYETLSSFVEEADEWKRGNRDHPLYMKVNSLLSAAKKYLLICEYYDEKFLTYVEIIGAETRVRVFCLDPSGIISQKLDCAAASVMFSATFAPMDYYTTLCGARKTDLFLELPSPFPEDNLCVTAVDTVSTRADDRDLSNCRKIATCIAATVSARAGNYICYFQSYAYMEKVYSIFKKKYPDVSTEIQKKGMTFEEKEKFISFFKDDTGILRIGFCVLGGSFSEGVDMPGNKLIGTVIVGTGIPGVSNERNILRDYYDLQSENMGYDYAYTYPGMNAVLQAAGRVIRRDSDRGIVVLIDDRYATPQYAAMYPAQWKNIQFAGNPKSLAEIARRFWKKSDGTN